MYDVTIVMTTGKVFRFQTDEESKPNEYQFRHLLVMMEFI